MKFILSTIAIVFSLQISAQDIFGKWKTIDDETGKAKSVVEIYEQNGKAYGKIIQLFRAPDEDQDPNCKECNDDRKGQKIKGMQIIRNLERDDNEWEDGTILDPKNGKIYDCKIWVDENDANKLQVRGYVAFFYRTQTWERIKEN